MTQLLLGAALLFGGVLALRLAKHSKNWRLASRDAFVVTAALVITAMISIGFGLLVTGIGVIMD